MNFRCLGVSMNLWVVAPTPRPADQQGCRCLYELMVCSSDTSELLPLPASPRVLIREASEARLTFCSWASRGTFTAFTPKLLEIGCSAVASPPPGFQAPHGSPI